MSDLTSSDWKEVTLGQLVKGFRGVSYRPENLLDHASEVVVTLLRATNIQNGNLTFEDVQFIPLSLVASTQILERGDIAVCMSNGSKALVGKSAQYRNGNDSIYTVGAFCSIFKPLDKEEANFVFHLFRSQTYQQNVDLVLAGSAINNLKNSSIEGACFVIPTSRARRKKIATILTGIDTAIEKTEALIAKYQQIKAGLMHDLFTRGVLPNGQLRPFELSTVTQFGKLPFGWKLGSILELTDPQRQPILTGPFGADLGNADFVAEGIPVLRIGNVQQGELDLSDLLYVTPRKAALLSRYRIKSGDLLFARQGATTGRNALATKLVDGFLINYHIIRVALDHERCAPLFVEAAFANEVVKRQIERDKGRGTREGINTAQITSLAFPIAPLNEQRQIAQILKQINLQIEATQAELNSYKMRKCGLMHDLLTGKVPVKVEEPEVVDG